MLRSLTIAFFILVCAGPAAAAQTKVGPERGAVMVVGGGSLGKDILSRFIELAGGPDALIIDVPTAGGNQAYGAETAASRSLRAAGARNVLVLHTIDRKVADSDSFVAPIRRAGGVWFEGGRQWHLVDRYAGTRAEREFRGVLDRGGIVGGTSAGASILSTFLLRGAREGNQIIVAPQYLAGFGYLRDVAIDQHVVARGRLRDLADSLLPRYPHLLGISEDEGTAWLVRGDSAEIIGRNKAFVYGGTENDPRLPLLTLRPGDRYDLAKRRVISRAIDGAGFTAAEIDSIVLKAIGPARGTLLVARAGHVLVNKSYNVPDDSAGQGDGRYATYMPTTTVVQFPLGNLSLPMYSVIAQNLVGEGKLLLADTIPGTNGSTIATFLSGVTPLGDAGRVAELIAVRSGRTFAQNVAARLYGPLGMHQTKLALDGQFHSNVDELYRFELGLQDSGMFLSDSAKAESPGGIDPALGWSGEGIGAGFVQVADFEGSRNAFLRMPHRKAVVILLTDSNDVDAVSAARAIAARLLPDARR